MDNIVITPAFYGVSLLLVVIAAAYFAWASRAIGRDKALSQVRDLSEVIGVAVREADAFYQMTNDQKYRYVSETASLFLRDRKINIPPDTVRAMIEGAVEVIHRAREQPDTYKPDNIPDHR